MDMLICLFSSKSVTYHGFCVTLVLFPTKYVSLVWEMRVTVGIVQRLPLMYVLAFSEVVPCACNDWCCNTFKNVLCIRNINVKRGGFLEERLL